MLELEVQSCTAIYIFAFKALTLSKDGLKNILTSKVLVYSAALH